jgi:hypothetical protein
MLDFFFQAYLDDSRKRPMDFLRWVDEAYDPVDVKARFRASWWGNALVDRVLQRE